MVFNGECLIEISYRREKYGDWTFWKQEMDGRLRQRFSERLSRVEHIILPGYPSNKRPRMHLGFLLQILGEVGLDGGSCTEHYLSHLDGSEIYKVIISVAERLSSYRTG